MTKGVLVILMVIYHSFNYSRDYTLGFKSSLFSTLVHSYCRISYLLLVLKRQEVAEAILFGCPSEVSGCFLIFTLLNLAVHAAGRHKLTV